MLLIRRLMSNDIGNGVRVAFDPLTSNLRTRGISSKVPYKEGFRYANLWSSSKGDNFILVEDWDYKRKYTIYLNGVCATDPIEVDAHPYPKYESEELVDLFKYLIQPNPWMSDEQRRSSFERLVDPVELLSDSAQLLFSVLEHGKVGYMSVVKGNAEVIMRSTNSERVSVFTLTPRFLTGLGWYMKNL